MSQLRARFSDKQFPQEDFITLRISDLVEFCKYLRAQIQTIPYRAIEMLNDFENEVLIQYTPCVVCGVFLQRKVTTLGVCKKCMGSMYESKKVFH